MVRFLLPAFFAAALPAQTTIQANIRGGGGSPKCTAEVEVDGIAEVTVRGQQGTIRTLAGQPATWRRLDCNQAMPLNPTGFRFRGIDGRGSQNLVRDPSSGRGGAVVRIEDPKSGREGYTFDLEWTGGSDFGGGILPGRPGRPGNGGSGGDWWESGNQGGRDRAIRACENTLRREIRSKYGYSNVAFDGFGPGRGRDSDRLIGNARAVDRGSSQNFRVGCLVNMETGRVRDFRVERQ
ncbi:MAG: hypothetical protein SFV18_16670 [Bryobacteraceae bacterium]|nr:hypothetical protein [Bryobacteraceae bacterium]